MFIVSGVERLDLTADAPLLARTACTLPCQSIRMRGTFCSASHASTSKEMLPLPSDMMMRASSWEFVQLQHANGSDFFLPAFEYDLVGNAAFMRFGLRTSENRGFILPQPFEL